MKCPNCGREIPDGHMYCDDCGAEINFVPDFEPEIENEINISLSGVANELGKEERLRLERREKAKTFFRGARKHWWKAVIWVLTGALAIMLIAVLFAYNNKSALYYMGLAESSRASGDMDGAIEYLREGVKENPTNSDIIFRLSDYFLEMGRSSEAVEALELITGSDEFSDDKVMAAYESIISIYKSEREYSSITALLNESDDEAVLALREKYIPSSPMMSPGSGTYEGEVTVTLRMLEGVNYSIYYTVNGDDPDTGSILYESEIVLDTDGEYDIKAVSANEYGICSPISENLFIVEKGAPAAPEIMEPSGDYNQNTMIVAVAEAGSTIFYTTDGSEPTMESKQYISPITMPVGTSHFRFIAFDQDGQASEIVDRDYHLVYTRLVSTEQAVNNLVSTLVRLDILLDNSGKVRGIEGHNEYIYNSVIEIQGAGEYYVVIENHVLNDGTSAPTGLMYAVNTHDGTVNRLGYDSSGKYTLITISNR